MVRDVSMGFPLYVTNTVKEIFSENLRISGRFQEMVEKGNIYSNCLSLGLKNKSVLETLHVSQKFPFTVSAWTVI